MDDKRNNLLTVELAYSDKAGFIGHRLTCGNETLLVFAQFFNGVEGFRAADRFVPNIGETISYNTEEIYPEEDNDAK